MTKTQEKLDKVIESLADEVTADKCGAADAMHYTQAMLNAANARRVLTPEPGDDDEET